MDVLLCDACTQAELDTKNVDVIAANKLLNEKTTLYDAAKLEVE